MNWLALPLADGIGDFLGILVGILFVIIAVVGQAIAKWRQIQEAGRRAAGGAGPMPPKKEGPLENEIGEFLREATARRAGRQVQPAGRRQPPKPPPTPPREKPVDAEVVEPMGQLRKRIASRKPRKLGSELGQEVGHADDKMAGHLQNVFDHQVSSLAATLGDSAKPPAVDEAEFPEDQITPLPSAAAAGLAALFANADSVRQAILINEVLQRPEHRWS